MPGIPLFRSQKGSLRQKILASVGAMVFLSLLSSLVNLYKITELNRFLEAINHVSVPLGRLFAQVQSDADALRREMERSLGQPHWHDVHWRPKPAPRWIEEVLENEMVRIRELIRNDSVWTSVEARTHWGEWSLQVAQEFEQLSFLADQLYAALEKKDEVLASEIYPKWAISLDEWERLVQWGAAECDRSLRQNFTMAENRVAELRAGLEAILVVVGLMSLLLLWLGERALRPLSDLTKLARNITRRGLRKEDKSLLPDMPLTRSDEVSQLAREFHHMATALLEREKTVETQKSRLQEQNRLLRDMGGLNQNILNSIESVLLVTDFAGKVTQCNPGAIRWLKAKESEIMGSDLMVWPQLRMLLEESPAGEKCLDRLQENAETWRIGPLSVDNRVFGGHLMPLREEDGKPHGAIIVLDDLTDEVDMQERLRRAENLAAVGRMSAQVAHEVRNPLHSIGLEAEMAAEMAARLGNIGLKQSLNSILHSVDRLQKITENYLKLSRLSAGEKIVIDLGEILEFVLATYSPVCEAQAVRVEWCRTSQSEFKVCADAELLEQVLGNLFRNSLQALEGWSLSSGRSPVVSWTLGETSEGAVFLRIQDNGPGIAPEVEDRLFVPFVTTRAQGTGLGLSFIKKVLEDHGGKIRNIKCPPGEGACFEIELASARAEVEKVQSAPSKSSVSEEITADRNNVVESTWSI